MELRLPTLEQLREFYHTEMKTAFPPAELKPLSAIERMWGEGKYRPYCLYDDGGAEPIGAAFLWMGNPGWALLDYLCVAEDRRNDGLGAVILKLLPAAEPDAVIFGEAEAPADAPDPAMAERRLGFYARCGLRVSGYDSEVFGVHYKTLYLYRHEIEDSELMMQHQFVYKNSVPPEKYEKFIRIPFDPAMKPMEQIPWDQ